MRVKFLDDVSFLDDGQHCALDVFIVFRRVRIAHQQRTNTIPFLLQSCRIAPTLAVRVGVGITLLRDE